MNIKETCNNETNLCDSCCHIQPSCEGMSEKGSVIYGDGVGSDNTVSCSHYEAITFRHPKHAGQEI